MSEHECFRVAVTPDRVATVTMIRAPVNAQNGRFREELMAIFDEMHDRADVGAVVLTGEGRTFSAGADLTDRPDLSKPGAFPRHNRWVREAFYAVTDCDKPVIAAINGPAIGAGFALALSCDIMLAAEDAWVSMTEVDVGLAGGVRHIMQVFSRSDARLMFFTARRVPAAELYRMCVVSAVHPRDRLVAEAQAIAREIAAKSPLSIRTNKRSFNLVEEMSLRDGYRYEQSQTVELSKTEDSQEARAAFREKRKPVFKGR
jgi:enoyl-CoA hydratase